MGEICVLAGEKFPEALKELKMWLPHKDISQPRRELGEFAKHLNEAGLPERFPYETLIFMDAVAANSSTAYIQEDIQELLSVVEFSDKGVCEMPEYMKLRERFPPPYNATY